MLPSLHSAVTLWQLTPDAHVEIVLGQHSSDGTFQRGFQHCASVVGAVQSVRTALTTAKSVPTSLPQQVVAWSSHAQYTALLFEFASIPRDENGFDTFKYTSGSKVRDFKRKPVLIYDIDCPQRTLGLQCAVIQETTVTPHESADFSACTAVKSEDYSWTYRNQLFEFMIRKTKRSTSKETLNEGFANYEFVIRLCAHKTIRPIDGLDDLTNHLYNWCLFIMGKPAVDQWTVLYRTQ